MLRRRDMLRVLDEDEWEGGSCFAIGLRWLAGGSYQEIEDVFGVSTTEAYRSRNKFIDALFDCDQLQIRLH